MVDTGRRADADGVLDADGVSDADDVLDADGVDVDGK